MKSLNTITTKLLMLVLFITLIPLVVQLNLSTNVIKKNIDDVKNFQLDLVADIVLNKFYSSKSDLEKSVIQASVFLEDDNFGISRNLSDEKLASALSKANVLSHNNYFFVLNRFGRVMAATNRSMFSLDTQYFASVAKKMLNNSSTSYIDYILRHDGTTTVAFYAVSPIYSSNKAFQYFMVGIKGIDNEIPDFIKTFTGDVVHIYKLENGLPSIMASNSYSVAGKRNYSGTIDKKILDQLHQNQSLKVSEKHHTTFLLSKYIPVQNLEGNVMSVLQIGLEESTFDTLINENMIVFAIISISSLLVAIILAALFARSITTPILKLVGITNEITAGNLKQDMNVEGTIEIKQLTTSLNTMIQTLDNEQKLKDDFVAALTHDLKVPMLAANHTIHYLLNKTYGDITEEQSDVLSTMNTTNKSSLEMINNLLEVYKYDAGMKDLNVSKVNINNLLTLCVNELKHFIIEKKILIQQTPSDNNICVLADELEIKRAIMNILSNSIYHSLPNCQITCSVISNNQLKRYYKPLHVDKLNTSLKHDVDLKGKLLVKIEDNGIGIPNEDIETVFKRFTSAKGRKPTGVGLGLYCTYLVIQKHSCDIWLESIEGEKTIIYFTLNQVPL